jgi:hypothetical protein
MDVKEAFDHVAAARLIEWMIELGVDWDLIHWTWSFLADWRIALVIDGHECLEQLIETGVPQSSPVSLILFVIYLSRVFWAIEAAVSEIQALFFTDDLDMLIAANSVTQISKQLQRAGEAAIAWGQDNTVQFDREKTEAVLFTRQ